MSSMSHHSYIVAPNEFRVENNLGVEHESRNTRKIAQQEERCVPKKSMPHKRYHLD